MDSSDGHEMGHNRHRYFIDSDDIGNIPGWVSRDNIHDRTLHGVVSVCQQSTDADREHRDK
jgi:hypothetical protein